MKSRYKPQTITHSSIIHTKDTLSKKSNTVQTTVYLQYILWFIFQSSCVNKCQLQSIVALWLKAMSIICPLPVHSSQRERTRQTNTHTTTDHLSQTINRLLWPIRAFGMTLIRLLRVTQTVSVESLSNDLKAVTSVKSWTLSKEKNKGCSQSISIWLCKDSISFIQTHGVCLSWYHPEDFHTYVRRIEECVIQWSDWSETLKVQ